MWARPTPCQRNFGGRRYGADVVNVRVAAGIPAAVLAHQGGWDEALLVAGPIAVVAGLLWLARRRVTKAHPSVSADPSASSADGAEETLR